MKKRWREWLAVYVLRLSPDLFEEAPEHSAFDRAPLASTCAGCVKVFKLLDGLGALHETNEEVNHFLMAMGIWWVHNMLRTRSLTALVTTFTETLNGAGVPVAIGQAHMKAPKKEAYIAH